MTTYTIDNVENLFLTIASLTGAAHVNRFSAGFFCLIFEGEEESRVKAETLFGKQMRLITRRQRRQFDIVREKVFLPNPNRDSEPVRRRLVYVKYKGDEYLEHQKEMKHSLRPFRIKRRRTHGNVYVNDGMGNSITSNRMEDFQRFFQDLMKEDYPLSSRQVDRLLERIFERLNS